MLFGLFSQVLRVKESIFGVQKAKFWAWKKIAPKPEKRKKNEGFQKILNKRQNVECRIFGGKKSRILSNERFRKNFSRFEERNWRF